MKHVIKIPSLLKLKFKVQKAKNKRLKNKVVELEKKLERQTTVFSTLENTTGEISIDKYQSYFKYKYNILKNTDVWNVTGRIFTYSRRSLFVARLFRYISVIVAFIETSAVFLLTASVLLIIIPAALLFTLILMFVDMLAGRKYNKLIIPNLKNKKILFLIAQKGFNKKRGSYFDKLALDYASNGKYYVIVVSKSLRDGLYLTARFEAERLVVIRETYYFRLRREISKTPLKESDIIMVR